jgi:hypothetical protein
MHAKLWRPNSVGAVSRLSGRAVTLQIHWSYLPSAYRPGVSSNVQNLAAVALPDKDHVENNQAHREGP